MEAIKKYAPIFLVTVAALMFHQAVTAPMIAKKVAKKA